MSNRTKSCWGFSTGFRERCSDGAGRAKAELGSHVDWESVVKTEKSWSEMFAVRKELVLMLFKAGLKFRSTKW